MADPTRRAIGDPCPAPQDMKPGIALVIVNNLVVDEHPFESACEHPRRRIAAGLCPACPNGKGVHTGWAGNTELLKCDTCPHGWMRGHRYRQETLFNLEGSAA